MENDFITSIILLFILLNPFLVIIYLIDIVQELTFRDFFKIIIRAGTISYVVFILFALTKDFIFEHILQSNFASFQVFGGIIFLIIGIRFVFQGVDAVIDKDLASAKLAEEVGVDLFLIATDVKGVALRYGKPDQEFLPKLSPNMANHYLKNGEFPPGSMGPKIEAAVQFIENGGKRALITSLQRIEDAVEGRAGTEILRANT